MATTFRKQKLGVEDVNWYSAASPTYSRSTSSGGSTTITSLGATNIPILNATGYFQTSNVERALNDIMTRYVNVEHSIATLGAGLTLGQHKEIFGFKNALNATTIQAAASNQFLAEGVARIIVPDGTHTAATAIALPRVTHIFGNGRDTVFRANATNQTSRIFTISGSVGATTSGLAANATADSSLVPLSDASNFSVSDWIVVRSGSATMELHQVKAISGNNVTVHGKLLNTFNSAVANATVVYPAQLWMDGMNIESSSATQGFGVAGTYLVRSYIGPNTHFVGQADAAVKIRRSSDNRFVHNVYNAASADLIGVHLSDYSHHSLVTGQRVGQMVDTADSDSEENYRHGVLNHGTYTANNLPVLDAQTTAKAKDLAIGLEFNGPWGGASSTTDILAKVINQGAIINALSLSSADVAAADFDTTNKKFGNASYILGAGNILAYPGYNNPYKGTLTAWYRNLTAGDYIAYNPLTGHELYLDGSGFQTLKITERTAATDKTKDTTTVAGSVSRAADTTFRNVTAKWRFNDENGASTDLLEMERNGTDEGGQVGSDDIDINGGAGGVWFIGAKRNDPIWDHFYAASGLPTAHSDAWTSNGTPNGAVSNGSLNIATTGSNQGFYDKTNNIDLQNMTVEFKMRLNSGSRGFHQDNACLVKVRDDSMNRSFGFQIYPGCVGLFDDTSSYDHIGDVFLDTANWHVYRITTSGTPSPTINLYIDGVLVLTGTLDTADATANDQILFGDGTAVAGLNSDSDWEYFKYHDAAATPPVAVSASGNIDSFGITKNVVSNQVIELLQGNAATDVFDVTPTHGTTLPNTTRLAVLAGNVETASTTFVDMSTYVYYVAGDGITEMEIDFGVVARNSGAGLTYIGMDVDNDIVGKDPSTLTNIPYPFTFMEDVSGNDDQSVSTKRNVVLSVGLHEIRPQFCVSANTARLEAETYSFTIKARDRKTLG